MKKVLGLLLASVMALSLVACNGNSGGGETSAEEKLEGEVVIWHTYTDKQLEYLEQAVADFNEANPGMTVRAESQPYDGFYDKVYQAVMAGNGPDILIHYASEAAKYVADGKVADLSQYLSEDLIAQLPETVYEEATSFSDGKLHILPIVSSGPIFFYNKTLYDELGLKAPETWEQLADNCTKIREKYPDMKGFGFDSLTDGGSAMIIQAGNPILDQDNNVLLDSPEVVQALEFWQENCKNGNFTTEKVLDPSYFSGDFSAGTIASYVGSAAGVPYLKPVDDSFEFAMSGVPQTEGGKKWTPAWNRGIFIFNYDDETRIKIAAKFTEYFASPEVNAGWCVACNYPALLADTFETETYKAFIADNESFTYLHPEYAGALPAVTAYAYTRTAIDDMMSGVATGKDIQEEIQKAIDYVQEKLDSE